MKFVTALLFAAVFVVSARDVHHRSYHEEPEIGTHPGLKMVKEHHGRRMKKLEELIEERRQILQEHESGRRKLSEDDYARASKQFLNFQRKFGEMKTYTDEDHHHTMEEMKSMYKHSMHREEGL